MEVYVWLALIVIGVIIEASTAQLMSIWFVFGFAGALVSYYFGAPLWLQITIMLVISFLSFVLTRPLVKKITQSNNVATNSDRNIGREGTVIVSINNLEATGQVKVGGVIWSARSVADETIPAGSVIITKKIEGNKLFVERKMEV